MGIPKLFIHTRGPIWKWLCAFLPHLWLTGWDSNSFMFQIESKAVPPNETIAKSEKKTIEEHKKNTFDIWHLFNAPWEGNRRIVVALGQTSRRMKRKWIEKFEIIDELCHQWGRFQQKKFVRKLRTQQSFSNPPHTLCMIPTSWLLLAWGYISKSKYLMRHFDKVIHVCQIQTHPGTCYAFF